MHGISLGSGCLVCSPDALSKRVSRDAEKARAVRIKTLKDAVAEAAVEWQRARNAPIMEEPINDPFFAASDRLGAAVDAYFAALKSDLDPDDGDPGIRWRKP
jgi:hypothetical protein